MNKKLTAILIAVVVVSVVFLVLNYNHPPTQPAAISDYKNAEYIIDGQHVKLENGVAESEAAPGSASKIITRYFGNELKIDLNGDGRNDVVFILTQERAGSGVFFYVVAALNIGHGYVGSEGYFLGDRIAPQGIDLSQKDSQKFVVAVNYADRIAGEPMTTSPSEGRSVYLKLDPIGMKWVTMYGTRQN